MRSISTTSLRSEHLSPSEWRELFALKAAITESVSSVHPEHLERFTELFARSLLGKGNPPLTATHAHAVPPSPAGADPPVPGVLE